MKNILKKGFTLIELLIVIGILGILIAAVLFTLNPAEAQRKSRDVQRLRDLGNIQTVMENMVQDGLLANVAGTVTANSSGATTACASNWLNTGLITGTVPSLCNYATKIPIDPSNQASTSVAQQSSGSGSTCVAVDKTGSTAYYYVVFEGSSDTYEINVRQESKAGCSKLEGDGGDRKSFVEAGTNVLISGSTVPLDQ